MKRRSLVGNLTCEQLQRFPLEGPSNFPTHQAAQRCGLLPHLEECQQDSILSLLGEEGGGGGGGGGGGRRERDCR